LSEAIAQHNGSINSAPSTPAPVAVVEPEVEVAPPVDVTPATPATPVVPPVIETKEKEMNIVIQHTPAETPISVPPAEYYVEPQFFGKQLSEILDYARSTQQNVLFTGPAGTGKSSAVRDYAHKRNLPMVTVECTAQIDQSITQGRFVPTGVGNETKWMYSQMATAIQQPSVILLNELTRMSPKAASLFLRLLQERELLIEPLNQVIKVHPECIIIADQNTGNGYTGTSKQDAALVDRFNIKLEFDYDTQIERQFIPSETLLEFATAIRVASNMSDQFSIPMSTRILKNFVTNARGLGFEFAVNSLLNNYPAMDGEREALKMRFDANLSQIASELGVEVGSYTK
jgi:MoxR-like ATPase